LIIDIEAAFTVGQDTYLDSVSPSNTYAVVFEDNLETGYFYAANTKPSLRILDALHIYNVADVVDKEKPCNIKIVWSDDGLIASLLINNYCHAIFDFEKRAGYCRNGFPDTGSDWTQIKERVLTDDLITDTFSSKA
jgi:hypothetical protein